MSTATASPIDTVLSRLKGVQEAGPGKWTARCPVPGHAHEDRDPSLTVAVTSDGTVLFKCHAGHGHTAADVAEAIGLEMRDLFRGNGGAKVGKRILATYDYLDADRNLQHQTVRFDTPDRKERFRQRRPDPDHAGRWIWKLRGMKWILYRLPDLLAADHDEIVFIVEGEKDVDRLWTLGLVATCNPMGAGKWGYVNASPLDDRRLAIIPDNDDPGSKHAQDVVEERHGKAASVVILPTLTKKPAGDISDWLDAGGSIDDLVEYAGQAPASSPSKQQVTTSINGNGQPRPAFDLTDDGNALRFVSRDADRMRWVRDRRCWAIWNDKRWVMDAQSEIIESARDMVRHIADEADGVSDIRRQEVLKWAARSHQEPSIKRLVSLAMSDHRLQITTDQFDSDPFLLNVPNGTIDLRTGGLREHRRDDLITKMSPVRFEPGARDDAWEKFLQDATGGHGSHGDPQLSNFLQRFGGYSISGDVGEELFAFVHGPAATGKSTFMEAVKAAIGDYAVTASFESFLERTHVDGSAPRSDLARLAGSRLVTSIEVEEGKRLAIGLVKWLSGRDTVVTRFMYQGEFEFRPTFTLWLVANHKPRVSADDDALWRRIKVLPFTHQVPPSERDPHLKARLADPAIGGPDVLAWLVEGCLKWQRDGLQVPDIVTTATAAYHADEDMLADFIGDRLAFGDPNDRATAAGLWSTYRSYCESNGIAPVGRRRFTNRLQIEGAATKPKSRPRTWLGVSIREPDP